MGSLDIALAKEAPEQSHVLAKQRQSSAARNTDNQRAVVAGGKPNSYYGGSEGDAGRQEQAAGFKLTNLSKADLDMLPSKF